HFPPEIFDIVLESYPERPVIEGSGKSSVYFRTRIYKAPSLCERDYIFHQIFLFFHHYRTTISSPWINAGSPESLVVRVGFVRVTVSFVASSVPVKTMLVTRLGAVPICAIEGVMATWKKAWRAAEENPASLESSPI